jgi:small GTP-binding protein
MKPVLDAEEQALFGEAVGLLSDLRDPLTALEATPEDLDRLRQAIRQLSEPFLLVIVGEFNSGKSAFINALLGEERLLPEGVTPTTARISIVSYGESAGVREDVDGTNRATLPLDWLREIRLVDTPGTNAILQQHQRITEEFVPRADLVLFVTSADRPFAESERLFLERIRAWGKKVLFVVNKIDLIGTAAEREEIRAYVEENARRLIGGDPIVFSVSSLAAQRAKSEAPHATREALWTESQFAPLETYILTSLDERERLRLKIANPLGVAANLTAQYLVRAVERQFSLQEDLRTVQSLHAQQAAYEADMRREFKYHLSHIDNVLFGLAERGNRFFEETVRLQRVADLINSDRLRVLFEREVMADTATQVELATRDLIDWMVDQDIHQWQAVDQQLLRRAALYEDQLVGHVNTRFDSHRQALLESVGRSARETIQSYDHEAEARQMAESVQKAVAQTALMEVGAVGLGALTITLLASTVADVTGLLAAGALATLGLYVLPRRRRKAQRDLKEAIDGLRERLTHSLTSQFEHELHRSLSRVQSAVRPYTHFVESQATALSAVEAELRSLQRRNSELSEAVARMR